jgi:glycosyltransferase involved in cell wall biosynthesis
MVYRIGFVMEQTLGQITHTQNFRQWVAKDPEVDPTWILIAYDTPGPLRSVPIVGRNWTVRASLEARARIREVLRRQPLDALFLHTQVTALFSRRLMAQIPSIVSMDATPINFDNVGGPYGHRPNRVRQIESVKNALMRRTFNSARKLVIWHEAGKRSLVDDYRIPPDKVAVIPPGIDMDRWRFARPASASGPVRLLFVGGDFRRKGGDLLLAAFRSRLMDECELDIVTREPVDTTGLVNVRVHHGLGPNVPELVALYARADVFIFPSLADMLPLAIMEALAAGLPVIATNVGALAEQVEHGVTGFLIPPGDEGALADTALRLIRDAPLRQQMGAAARRAAEQRFNGATNYPRILSICKSCADSARPVRAANGCRP